MLQVNNPYSGGTGNNGILEVGGSRSSIPIVFYTPGAPSVTPQGGTVSTIYSYQIVHVQIGNLILYTLELRS